MKVLQFVTKLELGGAQEICLDLCRLLLERGHEVHLLTAGEGELLPEARGIDGLRLHAWEDWRREIRPFGDLRCFGRLVGLLRRERYDLLHTHSSKAGLVGRLAAATARTPARVIHHVHGWSFNDAQSRPARRLYVTLERLAARPGYLLLSCSHATDRQGRAAGIGRDEDRRVVVNGIERRENLRRRDRAAIRRRLGLGRREILFLQLGNLKPQKDPLTFAAMAVAAGRRLHRARFWIAGDGPLRAETEAVARQGGLGPRRFRVLGWRQDVPELLEAADVIVLTSLFEGLPMAVLRAMAAGRPVLATAVDGTVEAVRHGRTGLLAEPGDVAALARAAVRLGRSPRLRRSMGLAGRRRSAGFSSRRVAGEVLRLYAGTPPPPATSGARVVQLAAP